MKKVLLVLLSMSFMACGSYQIYSTKDQTFVEMEKFLEDSEAEANYVLGEYHYDGPIQKVQSQIIDQVVAYHQMQGKFSVGWEFLLYQNQQVIDERYSQFLNDELGVNELILGLFPEASENVDNFVYAPIFEVAKKHSGEFLGLNASRKLKSEITEGGLSSIDSKLIPPDFLMGSENYFSRFKKAMSGHVSDEKLQRYYEAQCFTDSVMGYYMETLSNHKLRFTIVGSFHNDYGDGYAREAQRYSNLAVTNIKIVNGAKLSGEELEELLREHPEYGSIADFIFIAK